MGIDNVDREEGIDGVEEGDPFDASAWRNNSEECLRARTGCDLHKMNDRRGQSIETIHTCSNSREIRLENRRAVLEPPGVWRTVPVEQVSERSHG